MKLMIYFKLFSLFFILSSCSEVVHKDSSIPWYINERIKDGTIRNYSYADSLTKYQALNNSEIADLNKYKSYLIDLEVKIGDKSNEELKNEFEVLFRNDKDTICEKLIKPGLKYISPSGRPDRRYSRPYITAIDMDYFIDKCIECDLIEDSLRTPYEIGKLHLSNIGLKDQWFRMPSRKMIREIQETYDVQNMERVDELFETNALNLADEYVSHEIYILLLHSEDCNWTKKWIKIFIDNCSSQSKYKRQLGHFLNRSVCEQKDLIQMVENELKNL